MCQFDTAQVVSHIVLNEAPLHENVRAEPVTQGSGWLNNPSVHVRFFRYKSSGFPLLFFGLRGATIPLRHRGRDTFTEGDGMRFTIEMNLEGAAFQDNREGEAQHIADSVAEQLRRAMLSMSDQGVRPWMLTTAYAYDSNGNMVATITPNNA